MDSDERLIPDFHSLMGVRARRGRDVFPTVLGVGAGRCGTTTLYNVFMKTPGIYVPPVKEVNFFGQPRMSKDLYAMYFCLSSDEPHRCEISPYYLTQAGVSEQIAALLGPIKIIIQVREPTTRFISQFRHHFDKHGIMDFSDYVDKALQGYRPDVHASRHWFAPEKALSQSLYYEATARYIEIFGAENVLVIDYSEWKKPELLCRALSRFLNLTIVPELVVSSNESRGPKNDIDPTDLTRLREFFRDDYQEVLARFTVTYKSLAAPFGNEAAG